MFFDVAEVSLNSCIFNDRSFVSLNVQFEDTLMRRRGCKFKL